MTTPASFDGRVSQGQAAGWLPQGTGLHADMETSQETSCPKANSAAYLVSQAWPHPAQPLGPGSWD